MQNQPEPQQDEDAYWRSCKEFVRLLIAELNQTLKANRISAKKRRQICTEFAFRFCNFLDQEALKPDGRTQYPLLCFAELLFDIDVPLDLAQINFPHTSVEMHVMVADEIDWYFGDAKEDITAVPKGGIGETTAEIEVDDSISLLPQPCWTCKGTGKCFCVRKGGGDPTGCPRCNGSGQCRHCAGSGKS